MLSKLTWAEVAITQREGTIFWYNSTSTHVATYKFDYCNIAKCGEATQWRTNVCKQGQAYICVTDSLFGQSCASWSAAGWNTGNDWGYKPPLSTPA